ncbi:hypothetical protein M409DRAFT_55620 [Zasmidium cellare ATCC 36951]|uniref:Transcription factor domain-containing protein n=1 Tax=Zasmidium cellare ATCC 36951 TaxID=1080233 RepID=A0A6A6CGG9_ZASCE|nr:uncharacterized protein M409DRAFT_55620 [Zasmidium cellare ATCC 36951]KAF2165743.1 hypothetical protein M409DRAFT_55620 [Zasmidium cellare ATCC 36951]
MIMENPDTYLFVAVNDPGDKASGSELARPFVIRSRGEKSPPQHYVSRTPTIRNAPRFEPVRDSLELLQAANIPDQARVQESTTSNQLPSWTFLTVDPATAQPTKSARHNIRAHVARRQHRQRREQEALKRTASENEVPRRDGLSSTTNSPPSLLSSRRSSASRIETLTRPPTRNTNPPAAVTTSNSTLLLNPSDPADQLHLYARSLSTNVPQLWTCYLWQERQHGLLFHAQFSRFKGWGPKYLHPLILTNHAILATTVLFTGCLLRHHAGETPILSDDILALRSRTYGLVQSAIDAESSQLADCTILAVLKLALFEAIFGQLEAYRVHMQGLARMVALRNGWEGLGMDGYLAHLLMWFDANLARATRSRRFLEGTGRGELEEARADEGGCLCWGLS